MEELSYINKNSVSNRIVLVRSIFLRGLAMVYLIAYISLYQQFQGLWGDEGISPVNVFIRNNKEILPKYFSMVWMYLIQKGSFLQKIFPSYGFGSGIENYFFIICLIGIMLSFLIVINYKPLINSFAFFFLWLIHMNFYVIFQQFKFELDTMLVEVGFLAIFFAPFTYRNFNVITVIDNLSYYSMRFMLFKIVFGTGVHILGAKCPYWLGVDGLKYYFQSQPLPNGLSVLMHNAPDGIKKILSVFGYFCMIYLPFGYFMIWRRFNIFAGQLTAIFQLFIMMTGNYGYLQCLVLLINLSNFDDYYLYSVIPYKIIHWLGLEELNMIVLKYLNEMEREVRRREAKNKGKKKHEDEDEDDNMKEKKVNSADEERERIIEAIAKLRKEQQSAENNEDDSEKIEEIFLDENSLSSMFKEFIIFFNVLSVLLLFICFYLYPLKQVFSEDYHIKELIMKHWEFELNCYMIALFIYFLVLLVWNLIQRVKVFSFGMNQPLDKNPHDYDNDSTLGNIVTIFTSLFYFLFYLMVFIFFCMYFLANIQAFYSGVGLSLLDKKARDPHDMLNFNSPMKSLVQKAVGYSEGLYQKVNAVNAFYGIQRKIRGVDGRPEAEIEYLEENGTQWQTIEFTYKLSMRNKPKAFVPYLPRFEYLMNKAAYSESINANSWLAVLLGKLFERNQVVMDLLGYDVPQKGLYYRLSAVERIINGMKNITRPEMPSSIKKMKIEHYLYQFCNKTELETEGRIVKRKHNWEYLGNIEKYALSPIFERAELPEINDQRIISLSPFQYIPIIDLLVILFLLRLMY